MKMLRQVKLSRPSERGNFEDVFWIDAEFARVGKRIIDDQDRVWVVAECYGSRESKDLEREYRTWRHFWEVLGGG